MARNRKGSRRERELVNKMDEAGFAVLRAPASGSATERELPDVLAGFHGTVIGVEAKSSGGNPIYIDKQEVDDLCYFCENFGAEKRIGTRFDRREWRFFDPDELYRTPSGNYRVKEEDLPDGQELHELAPPTCRT